VLFSDSSITTIGRERVVILGSGWAGYTLARKLDPQKYSRTVISPRSYFVFTPLLASTAVGTLEFRATLESVRRLGLDAFHQGWADKIDFANKKVRVEANTADEFSSQMFPAVDCASMRVLEQRPGKGAVFDVQFDKLVIAVGCYSQTFGIEGVKYHANFLRDVGDARRIRQRVLQCFEKAATPVANTEQKEKLLHFAIVGAGPTGVEFAAELHDLVHDDLSKDYPDLMPFVKITVYDVAPKVLPMFDKQLSNYALDRFAREGIEVKTAHHIQSIRPDDDIQGGFKLKIKEVPDKEIGVGTVVWSTGLMQNPFVQRLTDQVFTYSADSSSSAQRGPFKVLKDPKTGGLLTDEHLRVRTATVSSSPASPSQPDCSTKIGTGSPQSSRSPSPQGCLPFVFTIGDCAVFENRPLPATAQVANQKAIWLANHLNRGNWAHESFEFNNLGAMAYIGDWKAIQQGGESNRKVMKGWLAWVIWRAAYLNMSVSWRNKCLILVYWALNWLFGRDITRF
jgi:NADH dehydrogenase FAD-containing subunit